jgi:hypothetical protein
MLCVIMLRVVMVSVVELIVKCSYLFGVLFMLTIIYVESRIFIVVLKVNYAICCFFIS